MLYDLRLSGSSSAVDKDSRSSRNGLAYHTHWIGNKLALTIEAEKDMPPPSSSEQTAAKLQANASSESTSTARQSTGTNDSQNTIQEEHDPQEIELNQDISTATMKFHFDRAVIAKSLSSFGRNSTAPTTATYLVVYYSVLNRSGTPIRFFSKDGILVGTDDGTVFTPDQDAMYVVQRHLNIDNDLLLQPDLEKSAVGAFEIPLKKLRNNASIYVSQNTESGTVPLFPNKTQTAKSESAVDKKTDKVALAGEVDQRQRSPNSHTQSNLNDTPKQGNNVTDSSKLIDDLLQAQKGSDENAFKSAISRLEAQTKPASGNVDEATRLNKLGVAKLKDQHYEDAAADFLSATTADPSDAKYLSNLGYAEMYAGKLDSARQHLDGSLKIDPSRSVAWGDLGILLAKQGRKDDSVVAFLVGNKVSKDGTIDFLKHLSSNAANDATVREASGLALVRLTQSDESSPTGQSAR